MPKNHCVESAHFANGRWPKPGLQYELHRLADAFSSSVWTWSFPDRESCATVQLAMAYHRSRERVCYRCWDAGPGILVLLVDVVGVDAERSRRDSGLEEVCVVELRLVGVPVTQEGRNAGGRCDCLAITVSSNTDIAKRPKRFFVLSFTSLKQCTISKLN